MQVAVPSAIDGAHPMASSSKLSVVRMVWLSLGIRGTFTRFTFRFAVTITCNRKWGRPSACPSY